LPHRPFLAAVSLSLALGVGFSARAAPSRAAERENLRKVLNEVIQKGPLKTARLSVQVQSLDDGAVVYSQHQDDLLNPASNVKLFTAATSLVKLGPEFRFETEFLTEGHTLYVRGKGDPSINTERLYGIVSELHHLGLKDIGDIVVDDGYFDDDRLAPGYDQESSDRPYMAPTGAVSLNGNSVGIYVRSGPNGRKAEVEMEPPSDFFILENNVVTSGKSHARRFSANSEAAGDKQKIVLRGSIPAGGEWSLWKKVDNPPIYFGQTLRHMLEERGIKAKGKVKLGKVSDKAKLFYVAQSDTFDLVLKRMNKLSSNFVAEQLIKTLGAEVRGAPGTSVKGVQVVEDFLEKEIGIPRGSYVMRNGSGLNDTNRFSAAQIARLLKAMYDRFPLAPEYLSSMGIAGKDGTLRYRFEGSEAVGRLRAKTGTLENVCALSGYVQSLSGEKFAFSMMVNDYAGRYGQVIQSIDAFGSAVAASGTPQGPSRAVQELMSQNVPQGSVEEAKARIRTYLALGKQGDKRNISFLRTAWRGEKDPAVRAVVAESIYQSNPQDYLGARALLDSFQATDEVYGRLRTLARDLKVDVPGVASVVELAAEGNAEALQRLIELSQAAQPDEAQKQELSDSLQEVARTAPEELVESLRGATANERDAVVLLLSRGLVKAADDQHPLWGALQKLKKAVDPELGAFSGKLEAALNQRITAEKSGGKAPVADGTAR
jgi:D-alanyl-D-alanine carboxypeptidase/D-alanyl-D-alanine-endopeptidase (penicillin-binding protein 4)